MTDFRPIPGLSELAAMAGRLKEVARQGWLDRGLARAESVADHSYRTALLAWAAARARGLNAERALAIALIHDLAEADTGDETPFDDQVRTARARHGRHDDRSIFAVRPPADPARRAARHARERAALAAVTSELPAAIGADLLALWDEYDRQATAEARLVKEVDRVETALQAREYAARFPNLPIDSFLADARAPSVGTDLAALLDSTEPAES